VLLVDDEPSILFALGKLLKSRGFEVWTADNGAEAMEVLEAHAVDVVVSDVCMPVMDGPGLLGAMRAHLPPIVVPVIMLSGYGDSADQALYDLGAVAILGKPISGSDLVAAIHAVRAGNTVRESPR
jgi:CheY-like chemotaxis protein